MLYCSLEVFFGLGNLDFYRKCVLCIHKEVSAACLCILVFSIGGMLLVCWAIGNNIVSHGKEDI